MTDNNTIQQLQKAREALKNKTAKPDSEVSEILHARAQVLAAEKKTTQTESNLIEVLEFVVSNEHYGIDVHFVDQVYTIKPIVPLPGTPEFMLGITHIKGNLISVIDIKKLFGLPEKGIYDQNKIILIYYEDIEVGLLADTIIGYRFISEKKLQSNLATLKGIKSDYFRGVTSDQVILLDIQKMLSDKRIIINEEIQ